mgnify:CR=1 FL=1
MNISTISSKNDIKEFHEIPYIIYKNNKNWIPHIKQEVETIFNPKKNKFHSHGEIERFILKNDNNDLIGRIAVFIDNRKLEQQPQPTGGLGFAPPAGSCNVKM